MDNIKNYTGNIESFFNKNGVLHKEELLSYSNNQKMFTTSIIYDGYHIPNQRYNVELNKLIAHVHIDDSIWKHREIIRAELDIRTNFIFTDNKEYIDNFGNVILKNNERLEDETGLVKNYSHEDWLISLNKCFDIFNDFIDKNVSEEKLFYNKKTDSFFQFNKNNVIEINVDFLSVNIYNYSNKNKTKFKGFYRY